MRSYRRCDFEIPPQALHVYGGPQERCELRLIPSARYIHEIPRGGRALAVIAAVDDVLYFRQFDDDGKMVVDTDETYRTEQLEQIEGLRKQLVDLLCSARA